LKLAFQSLGHAPYQTIVEGRVENGKVVDLKVTPQTRAKDVVNVMTAEGSGN